jgi:hypothetical protein
VHTERTKEDVSRGESTQRTQKTKVNSLVLVIQTNVTRKKQKQNTSIQWSSTLPRLSLLTRRVSNQKRTNNSAQNKTLAEFFDLPEQHSKWYLDNQLNASRRLYGGGCGGGPSHSTLRVTSSNKLERHTPLRLQEESRRDHMLVEVKEKRSGTSCTTVWRHCCDM